MTTAQKLSYVITKYFMFINRDSDKNFTKFNVFILEIVVRNSRQ